MYRCRQSRLSLPEPGALKISFEREVALGTPLNDKFAQLMDKKNELLKRREEKERTLSRDKSISQLEFAMLADSLLSDYDASLAAVYASQLKEHPDDVRRTLLSTSRTTNDKTTILKRPRILYLRSPRGLHKMRKSRNICSVFRRMPPLQAQILIHLSICYEERT